LSAAQKDTTGSIAAAILNSESSFPKPQQVFSAFWIKAEQSKVSFTVHDLPAGQYAITAYHDENDNGKLDADPIRLPSEGYGMSNDAREPLAPPQFAKASFEVKDQAKTVTINLKY
jgi:uncharacterized protein (DUF2141 family)